MEHSLAVARTAEQGKDNLDAHGYTVHVDFLTAEEAEELAALRQRLEEQAELERAEGVTMLSSSAHSASDVYVGAPRPAERIGFQAVRFLPNEGRPLIDVLHKPITHDYAAHLFRDEAYNVVHTTGSCWGGATRVKYCTPANRPFRWSWTDRSCSSR
ncbi:hypothetical protein ACIRPX_34845 [Streptomyces sp. NPDC101225]|uniref:hypothetical protein n=1 Tax=Streptomyces sp. NPDC101225 TaxID=3366135 RepID=UPI003821BB10